MSRCHPPQTGLFAKIYEPVERPGLGELLRRGLVAYSPAVSPVTGIDPDEAMLARATDRVRGSEMPVRPLASAAENLSFSDESFDAVTAFPALCTVRDQGSALRETWRGLAPGGGLRLPEHTRVEREPFGRRRETLVPTWKRVAGGRHLGGIVLRIYARRT